jgi:uncharacterized membrane protein YhaH (DUF805 family)
MSISKILFSFAGRIPRSTYWFTILGIWAAFFTFFLITALIRPAIDAVHTFSEFSLIIFLRVPLFVCTLWSILAVNVKRWHDRGKSGFWVLIYLVPVIGPFWTLIELGFLEGTQGLNEFEEGNFPKKRSAHR